MSAVGRIVARIGWTLWNVVPMVGLAFGLVGLLGTVEDTETTLLCADNALVALFDGVDRPATCEGEAFTQVLAALPFSLAMGWIVVRRIVMVRRVRRWRRTLSPPGWDEIEPAFATEATRAAYRGRLTTTVAAAVGLTAGFVLFGFLLGESGSRLVALQENGVRVRGTVTDTTRDFPYLNDSVHYRYEVDGEGRAGVVLLDDESPRYDVGEEVVVLADPDTGVSTLKGEDNDPAWLVAAMIVLFIGGIAGPFLLGPRLLSWWRMSLVLRQLPWVPAKVRIQTYQGYKRQRLVALVEDPRAGPQVLGVGALEPNPLDVISRKVWVAGAPGVGYVVAREGGGGPLMWAFASGMPGRTRWWSTEFVGLTFGF